jgi:hypothetical protein
LPDYGKLLPDGQQRPTLVSSVLGVLPAADCRPIDPDHVSCPLLIDFRDRLLEVAGIPAITQLKGEFTFERNGDNWETGDDFDANLTRIVAAWRFGTLPGAEASHRLRAVESAAASASSAPQ